MLTMERFMDITLMKKQGLKMREIARKLGIHRKTVKRYLEDPLAALRGRKPIIRPSKLDPYLGNIKHWLDEDEKYRASWIYDRLIPMGFSGSYQIVKLAVRDIKEEQSRVAYLRFETEPGCQAQVDFGEFVVDRPGAKPEKYYCFLMILGFSRYLYAEFVKRCDLTTFLDCHIRAFRYFGGVPREILYDRMRNVYLGKLAGKDQFNRSLTSLAIHYGFKPEVAPAYAPWVKGKVERPYSFIRENFWRGYGFTDSERANRDLLEWLVAKAERIHGTTHEKVIDRYNREKPTLGLIAEREFDTSYKIFRPVHKDCMVSFEANRYMAPHRLVGQDVMLRIKDKVLRMFDNAVMVAKYEIPEGKGQTLRDEGLMQALMKDRENKIRKYRNSSPRKGHAKQTISPTIPSYAIPVEVRPMSVYDGIGGEVR